jgi:hypothetical protein
MTSADFLDAFRGVLEDAEDGRAAIDARRELAGAEATPIPWDEVKAELGLS